MASAEKISRYSSVDCVVWLLGASFMQIYFEKEQPRQREKNVQFEKRSTKKYNGAQASGKEKKGLKKSLMLNGIKGVVVRVLIIFSRC